MHLIGFTGKARAGKDTAANYLATYHGFIVSSFALPLKRAAKEMFGLTEEQMQDAVKETVIDYWGISPRTMFQKLGTEGGRQVFGDELWLKRWKLFYLTYKHVSHIVVTDVRFPNEADMIRDLGGTIVHIKGAPEREAVLAPGAKAHASEAGVPFDPHTDVRLHNTGTVAQLHGRLDELMHWVHRRDLIQGDAA